MTLELQKPEANAQRGVMRVGSGDLLGRDNLPDHFEIIVQRKDMMMADAETIDQAWDDWMRAKVRIKELGYMIWQSFDDEKNAYIISCTKRPNEKS